MSSFILTSFPPKHVRGSLLILLLLYDVTLSEGSPSFYIHLLLDHSTHDGPYEFSSLVWDITFRPLSSLSVGPPSPYHYDRLSCCGYLGMSLGWLTEHTTHPNPLGSQGLFSVSYMLLCGIYHGNKGTYKYLWSPQVVIIDLRRFTKGAIKLCSNITQLL